MFNFSDAAVVEHQTLGSLCAGETFYFKNQDRPMIKTDEVDDENIITVSLYSGVILRECQSSLVHIVTLSVTSTIT